MSDLIGVGDYVLLTPDDGNAYEVLAVEGRFARLSNGDGGEFVQRLDSLVVHLEAEYANKLTNILFDSRDFVPVPRPGGWDGWTEVSQEVWCADGDDGWALGFDDDENGTRFYRQRVEEGSE